MTEDEAKTKWCVECLSQSNAIYSRCQGSDCMAWRWLPRLTVNRPQGMASIGGQTVTKDHGYCGLAGKPEVLP